MMGLLCLGLFCGCLLLAGFYTIGPCGEELLSAVGANIRPTDPLALHYRHVAVSISRQLGVGQGGAGEATSSLSATCSVNYLL
jgi:hypothetical protein